MDGWDERGGGVGVVVASADGELSSGLVENLCADRFDAAAAASANDALSLLERTPPDALVLDGDLADGSALELIERVRDAGPDAPWDPGLAAIVLSRRGQPHHTVRALERGADDVVATPFHYPELLARLGAAVRRARGGVVGGVLRVRELSIDRNARRASISGRRVPLAAKEFALLVGLARHPARVFTKEELLRDVWGFRSMTRTRTVDSHASRLRRKLVAAGARTEFVENVWGVGYRLIADD